MDLRNILFFRFLKFYNEIQLRMCVYVRVFSFPFNLFRFCFFFGGVYYLKMNSEIKRYFRREVYIYIYIYIYIYVYIY